MKKVIIVLAVCCLLFVLADAQTRRNRSRNRGRGNKKGPNCHLKEIDKCMEKLDTISKRPQASDIITTDEGINELCSTVTGTTDCFKGYMKKCGTPIQRELFEFMMEQFVESVKEFCNGGEHRETFLKHSPCINSKVLTKKTYHNKCVNDIFAAFNKAQGLINQTLDDPELFNLEKSSGRSLSDKLLDITCCAYNRFEKCSNDLITKECGPEGVTAMNDFAEKTFGGGMNRICPKRMFNPSKQVCTDILPPSGSDPKTALLKSNPFGKYFLSYVGFLFNFES